MKSTIGHLMAFLARTGIFVEIVAKVGQSIAETQFICFNRECFSQTT